MDPDPGRGSLFTLDWIPDVEVCLHWSGSGRGSLFTLDWIRTWKSVYTGLDPDVEVCLHWTGSIRDQLTSRESVYRRLTTKLHWIQLTELEYSVLLVAFRITENT